MELMEDTHPLGRKRELAGITPDTHRAEYDFLRGEPGAPSAPDAPGALALPRQLPFKVGWKGKARAEEPAKDRFEKIEQRFQKREAFLPVRREYIRDNNDKTGLHPITSEVVDPKKHVERNGRDRDPDVSGRSAASAGANARDVGVRRAKSSQGGDSAAHREDFILKKVSPAPDG